MILDIQIFIIFSKLNNKHLNGRTPWITTEQISQTSDDGDLGVNILPTKVIFSILRFNTIDMDNIHITNIFGGLLGQDGGGMIVVSN